KHREAAPRMLWAVRAASAAEARGIGFLYVRTVCMVLTYSVYVRTRRVDHQLLPGAAGRGSARARLLLHAASRLSRDIRGRLVHQPEKRATRTGAGQWYARNDPRRLPWVLPRDSAERRSR